MFRRGDNFDLTESVRYFTLVSGFVVIKFNLHQLVCAHLFLCKLVKEF